jgi:hypothetical protein
MVRLSAFFLLGLLTMLPMRALHAQIWSGGPSLSCQPDKLYAASNHAGAPPAVEAAIEALSGPSSNLMFATCSDGFHNLHYFLRESRPNRDGVCRQYENEIFLASDSSSVWVRTRGDNPSPLKGWRSAAPAQWGTQGYKTVSREFALLTNGECPSGFDPRYMVVTHITDGMLKSFDAHWHETIRSPEAFDKAFAGMQSKYGVSVKDMQKLEASLRDDALQNKVRFTGMSCGDKGDGCTADTNLGLHVEFDVAEGGIALTSITPTWVE